MLLVSHNVSPSEYFRCMDKDANSRLSRREFLHNLRRLFRFHEGQRLFAEHVKPQVCMRRAARSRPTPGKCVASAHQRARLTWPLHIPCVTQALASSAGRAHVVTQAELVFDQLAGPDDELDVATFEGWLDKRWMGMRLAQRQREQTVLLRNTQRQRSSPGKQEGLVSSGPLLLKASPSGRDMTRRATPAVRTASPVQNRCRVRETQGHLPSPPSSPFAIAPLHSPTRLRASTSTSVCSSFWRDDARATAPLSHLYLTSFHALVRAHVTAAHRLGELLHKELADAVKAMRFRQTRPLVIKASGRSFTARKISPTKESSHVSSGGEATSPAAALFVGTDADAATSRVGFTHLRPESTHRRSSPLGITAGRPLSAMQATPSGQPRCKPGSPSDVSIPPAQSAARARKSSRSHGMVRSTTVATITPRRVVAPLHSLTDSRQRPPSPPRSKPSRQIPQIPSFAMTVSSPFYSSYLLRPPTQSRSGVAWDAPWGWDTSSAHSPPRSHAVLHPEPVTYGSSPRPTKRWPADGQAESTAIAKGVGRNVADGSKYVPSTVERPFRAFA